MDKINKESPDLIKEYQEWLEGKFHSCFVEGKFDFQKLKQLVSKTIDEHDDEKYAFSWSGRSNSIKNIQTQSKGTLIPVKEDSVHFDESNNLFIEGENLEVLKLLSKTFSNKIKMIYIDPPYNTGSDFIYKDDFKDSLDSYLEQTGQSKNGIKLTSNPESSGRFHSDWMSFIYPRLFLGSELLTDDGVIFISIGQEELVNLVLLCNEIFGEDNKVGIITRMMKSGSSRGDFFSPNTDYILVYAKNIELAKNFRLALDPEYIKKIYRGIENQGSHKGEHFREMGLYQSSLDPLRGCTNQRYWIQCPDGSLVIPPGNNFPQKTDDSEKIIPKTREDNVWRWSQKKYLEEKNNLIFKETKTSPLVNEKNKPSKWNVYTRIWLNDRIEEGKVPTDLITKCENRHSAIELKELGIPFDYAKPSSLISHLISFMDGDDFIVLDFFAGSGTTAHAVLDFNITNNKNLKFLLVQLPEKCDLKSFAHDQGFNTISNISKERIRRVIKKITDQKQTKLTSSQKSDLGFKVFQLTKSNYKIWEDVKDETTLKEQLKLFEDPLIENYKDIDVIYEIILKEGYSLNSKIEEFQNKPNKIYKVTDDDFFFYVTLDQKLDEKSTQNLNLDENTLFACLDSALDDSQKTNLDKKCLLKTI